MSLKKERPETIENQWDILYRDYPEVYDEFAAVSRKPSGIEVVRKMFPLEGKIVADIGSGSGKSTIPLAKYAKKVIGIEPEDAMRNLAIKNAKGIKNIEFRKGWAKKIPLKNSSVDYVTGFTLVGLHNFKDMNDFVREASRIIKNNGFIISLDIAPKWYGGELAPIILGKTRTAKNFDFEERIDNYLKKLGFKHKDFFQIQDYKSVKNAIRTYGFIFGKKTIDYIEKHKKTKIKWKLRVNYKRIK